MARSHEPRPDNIGEIDARIAKLSEELEQLTAARRTYDEMTPQELLAIELHGRLCRRDHAEACAWYYELDGNKHDWGEPIHQQWLASATRALKLMPRADLILQLIDACMID